MLPSLLSPSGGCCDMCMYVFGVQKEAKSSQLTGRAWGYLGSLLGRLPRGSATQKASWSLGEKATPEPQNSCFAQSFPTHPGIWLGPAGPRPTHPGWRTQGLHKLGVKRFMFKCVIGLASLPYKFKCCDRLMFPRTVVRDSNCVLGAYV